MTVSPDDMLPNCLIEAKAYIAEQYIRTLGAGEVLSANIGTGEVSTANMAVDPTNASNLSSGSVPLAQLGNAPSTDTTNIEADIALLGFKVAVAGSMSKYNLIDQTEDSFVDSTGIDAGSSVSASLTSGYYSGNSILQTYTELVATAVITAGMLSQSGLSSFNAGNLINGAVVAPAYGFYTDSSAIGSWCRLDFGAGNAYALRRWGWYMGAGGTVYAEWKVQHSDDSVTWTDWNSGATFGGHPAPNNAWQYSGTPANVLSADHRYWRTYKTDTAASGHFHMELLFDAYDDGANANMVLQSNATTAEATATKGDIVMTYTNGIGTATLNTDLTAEFSADNGSNWTSMTLAAQGTTGSASPHFIASAHNVTAGTSGTAMKYRIKTLNQGAAKSTRIQAVSLGWS